ncbi:MAG: TIGR02594 family protein [Bradyrhizobium sp.]|uniref:TIGR02594 family protein n=1 Tax=Bradyrhizobium sp. TaxID=376 RepID=UPI002726A847|nr:TIGR02594 family protein [Bradyrhizobium sp.]MDO9561579.1 TIGR02594 family protein [Bradyrhizobium sp.]MDP3693239.1 TIGR02594 family protein [Bradyrhizobium sp.]
MALFAIAAPASAKPQNGAGRHAHAHHAGQHARHHHSHRHHRHIARAPKARRFGDGQISFTPSGAPGDVAIYGGFGTSNVITETRRSRRVARASRWERGVARMKARGTAGAQASVGPVAAGVPATATPGSVGSSAVVAEARRHLGGNPTGRGRLWCARFMNMVLERSGHRGTGSDMARSFAGYGQRVSGPQVGAIAVMSRGRGGGHVGVVSGIDAQGNPIVVSGNNGNRVREAPVSRGRIYAYVMPN